MPNLILVWHFISIFINSIVFLKKLSFTSVNFLAILSDTPGIKVRPEYFFKTPEYIFLYVVTYWRMGLRLK
jgi:hypothetical protein